MIKHRTIALEPWALRETELDLNVLAETESVFALSNGHIGLRGNLDEGDPHELPGTYLNAFYEVRPLPYPELGYGNPDAGQTVVNVTNGKLVRLLVDDEPFDVRYGELRSHERVLDLRAGVLRRTVDWISPAGPRVHVQSTRLVSFVQRSIVAISYEVEAVDADIRVVIQSELLANEPVRKGNGDPRAAAALAAPLRSELARDRGLAALLMHSTSASGLLMAASMDHMIDGPKGTESMSESFEDQARVAVTADLKRGEHLRLVKLVAYGWSGQRLRPSVAGQVRAAVLEARHAGWDGLLAGQRAYLDDFWGRADRAWLRRPHLLGHGGVRPADAHLHRP
jgi:alpha,alpha-trehalose phosphorylase